MYWYGPGYDWLWGLVVVGALVIGALLIVVIVLLARALSRLDHLTRSAPPGAGAAASAPGGPESVLAERYARGEIDEEEYRRRLATLRGGPAYPPGPPAH